MATTTARQIDPNIKAKSICSTMTVCPITKEQEKLWIETRMALLWACPAFAYICYNMMNPAETKEIAFFTKDVPIAATDGVTLFLNPDTFFKYPLKKRVFIVAHEIMHCILDHCGLGHALSLRKEVAYQDGKKLPYDAMTMNVATDLIINDALITAKIGEFDQEWLHDPKLGQGHDSAIDVYRKVYQPGPGGNGKGPPPPPGGSGSQPPGGTGGNCKQPQGGQTQFDQHLKPGTGTGQDPTTAQQKRNPGEWQAALAAAKTQGKLPANLERIINELLEPQVSWAEKIQAFFARKVGSGSYDWRRPDRRLIVRDIYSPGRSGFGTGTVVVVVDTSGSIGQREIDYFLTEVGGIIADVNPKRLFLVWCDAQVAGYEEIDDRTDLKRLKPRGGGGTDFRPPFQWVKDMQLEPDALVYLTDLYGAFPNEPAPYPVIWARTSDQNVPWGEVVDVPIK